MKKILLILGLIIYINSHVSSTEAQKTTSLQNALAIPNPTAPLDHILTNDTTNGLNNNVFRVILKDRFTWGQSQIVGLTDTLSKMARMNDTVPSGKIMTKNAAETAINGLSNDINGKVSKSTTITINGDTKDLSANRSWMISTDTNSLSNRINTKFNSPTGTTSQYIRGDGSLATLPTGGTVTSVGLSSTDLNVSGSPVTNSGTITANLTNTGISSGTYRSVTVDAKGRATSGTNPTISSATRSLNTSYQVSTTLNARVSYTVSLGTAVNLLNLNSAAQVYLEISPNNSTWTTVNAAGKTQTLSVAITLGITETNLYNLQCEVPAGYWVRLRSSVSGGGTASYNSGQETTY